MTTQNHMNDWRRPWHKRATAALRRNAIAIVGVCAVSVFWIALGLALFSGGGR